MYDMFTLQSVLRIWQMSFCDGDYSRCERHIRSSRGESVPPTLLPNGKELVQARRPPSTNVA